MRSRALLLIFVALALVAAACADDGEVVDSATPTADGEQPAVGESSGDTVVAPESTAITETTAAPVGLYSSAIKPTLQANCVSCHSEGGPGSAHFDLNIAADAKNIAPQLALVTGTGYMPPWPASDLSVPFHDDRSLDPEQIAAIAEWAEAGGPLDVPDDDPLEATVAVWPQIERDAVLIAEPYKGSTDLVDDYRCQIYDPELTETSFLQNYELLPDQIPVVHHALVFHAPAASRAAAEELDAADPAVGWRCGGLSGVDSRQIMGWAPGQQPTIFPADTGIQMEAGDFIVMQIHYHYEPEFEALPADESAFVMDFAGDEVIAAAGGEITPLDLSLYLGPAEIPCADYEEGPLCDRDEAIRVKNEEGGGLSSLVADGLIRQCGYELDDFASMTDGVASSTCDLDARPGQIVSLFVHLHEIGSKFRLTLNPDTPDEVVLVDVPNWSFDWQLNYYPADDIVIEEGDIIRVDCEWDRSLIDPDAEPRYVFWSEGTDDEMCYSQIFTRPVG